MNALDSIAAFNGCALCSAFPDELQLADKRTVDSALTISHARRYAPDARVR
jgi:hypothetical protein